MESKLIARSASNENYMYKERLLYLTSTLYMHQMYPYLDELPLWLLPDDELREPDERLRDLELRELPLLERESL